MIITTVFDINDRVEIIEIGRTGTITLITWDGVVVLYSVRYFDNSTPIVTSFYGDELKKVTK